MALRMANIKPPLEVVVNNLFQGMLGQAGNLSDLYNSPKERKKDTQFIKIKNTEGQNYV